MHEWLSGGASPCQGEGRGFESRLVLFLISKKLPKELGGFFSYYSLYNKEDSPLTEWENAGNGVWKPLEKGRMRHCRIPSAAEAGRWG